MDTLQQTYRVIFENMAQGAFYQMADGSLTDVNPAALDMLGVTREDFLVRFSCAQDWRAVTEDGAELPPEEFPSIVALRTGQQVRGFVAGIRNPQRDSIVWLSIQAIPLFDEGVAVPSKVFVILQDVSDEKHIERLQQQVSRQYELLTDTSMDGYWVVSSDGQIISANNTFCRMYGYDPEELHGKHLRDFDAIEDEAAIGAHIDRIKATGHDRFETRHQRKDGSVIDVEVSTTFIPERGIFLAYVRDITEKKRTQSELLEIRELFTLFMKYTPVYTFIKQVTRDQSRVIMASDNFIHMVGRTAEEMSGRTMYELFPEEFARKITADDIAVIREGKVVQLDEDLHGRRYTTIKFPIIREGKESLLAGFTIDITDHRNSEDAIRQQAQLLDVAHDSIVVRDMDDRITYWNQGAVRHYGFTRDEALGQVIHELLQTRFPAPLPEIVAQLYSQDSWEGELQHTIRAGSLMTVASRWVMQRDTDGQPVAVLEINNDLTQMKKAEKERDSLQAQMFHTQKLESLGVLAGGIAHDFNNILTSIIGNTELALLQLDLGSPVAECLTRVQKASFRAADLARQMLAYSGKGRFVVEPVDLNRLVEEMVHMLETSLSKKATLRLNLAHPLRNIHADATQMRQVVMNLVINASEALGDEVGEVTISTAQGWYDTEALQNFWLQEEIPAGFYISLTVSDTGCGIATENLAKIFDPFFTTKFIGRGLGMAAVLGIVRSHKGAIGVESGAGQGSTFTVLLPASDYELMDVELAERRQDSRRTGAVLLVDDEEAVCELGRQMLGMLGYEVVTARNGQEALDQYRHRDDFAFVILDLTMPVMDGEQTFDELRKINSEAIVIITSGYSEQEVANRFAGKGVKGVLQKPFNISALRNVIDGANSAAPPAFPDTWR